MHPFRFGVQVSRAADPAAWRDLARRVEALGYSTLFMPDHLDDQWAPLVALTVAAEATTTLRVGTLVLGLDYRHPLLVAKEAATLDLLSGGRLELGIGAGWMTADYEQSGIPLDPAGTRVARLGEAVAVLEQLWRDGRSDHAGRHYRLAGASGFPAPTGGGPRLLIGGGGRRVLELAARHADIVGVNPSLAAGVVGPDAVTSARAERYDARLEWVRAAAAGRFERIELQALTFLVHVGDDAHRVLDEVAPAVGLAPDDLAASPIALVGSVAEIVDRLEERRRRWGFSYWVVHEAEVEAFAPVVARLTGR